MIKKKRWPKEPSLFNNYYPINFRSEPNFEILNIFIGHKYFNIKREALFKIMSWQRFYCLSLGYFLVNIDLGQQIKECC